MKIACFVPTGSLEAVRTAAFEAGAGRIGAYTECSWSTAGTGTFRGGEGTNPSVGTAGSFEQASEVRFEAVCPSWKRDQVGRAIVAAHPYEEPAWDCYPLRTPASVGIGRRVDGGRGAHLSAALSKVLGDSVQYHATLITGLGRGGVGALTSGSVTALIPTLLGDRQYDAVACSSASPAERDLLLSVGIDVVIFDRSAAIRQIGEQLASGIERALGFPVRFAARLAFPGAK
jgi:hypothetical protein